MLSFTAIIENDKVEQFDELLKHTPFKPELLFKNKKVIKKVVYTQYSYLCTLKDYIFLAESAKDIAKEINFCYDLSTYNEREALGFLITERVIDYHNHKIMAYGGSVFGPTLTLMVNCNDIFMWGCAESEDLLQKEIMELYLFHISDRKWGSVQWCCFKRNEKPQEPVIEYMIRDKSWNAVMEALPDNKYDSDNAKRYNNGTIQ